MNLELSAKQAQEIINKEIKEALQGGDFTLELDEQHNKATFMFDDSEYLNFLELDIIVEYEIDNITCDKNYHNNNYEYEFKINIISNEDVELETENLTAMEYEIYIKVDEESVAHEYRLY